MNIVDMHCDTISRLASPDVEKKGETLWENQGHLDLKRMKETGYLLQNFALFVEGEKDGDPWERVKLLYRKYREELERNEKWIAPVSCFSDIERNRKAGKMSALLTVEEGAVCQGEIAKLEQLYQWGVRMLTLTWNFTNELGEPNFDRKLLAKFYESTERSVQRQEAFDRYFHTPNVSGGLTERGKEFVVRMEELGMIPDVSHLSDAGFYDVLAVTKKPFAASHSNARTVSPCVRNLTDDMILKLAERGGVMGLNFCPDFLEETPAGTENPGTIRAVVRHAKHIVQVGGVEVLGLGSDFDGIEGHRELPGVQSMDRLWGAMKTEGFTESNLDLIFGENVLRMYRDTLQTP